MAAPSGTVWGSIVNNHGRIGISTSVSSTATQTTVTVQAWFWTWYSCEDSYNTLYLDIGTGVTAASTNVGSTEINHTRDWGEAWHTDNQTCIYNKTFTYTRGTSAATYKVYARYADIDYIGASMYANTSFTIPALASYTVSYNANGGSGAPSAQAKWYGKTLTLSSTKPTRTGYSFQGWATSASGGVAYASGASYTANAAVTLYAVWKANTYTVSYNANGGTGAPSNQTKTYGVTLTLSNSKPTRTNYNFLGWATSASATSATYAAGGSYTANAAVTLYAVWQLAYTKPRITNLTVSRWDSETGAVSDTGTSGLIAFDWESDQTISSIVVAWKSTNAGTGSKTIAASGTSARGVNEVFADGALSTEATYSITLTVTDTNGYSVVFGTLNGTAFAIDFLSGGRGAAFGKPAELDGVLDIAFKTRHLGGLLPVVLEPETDLNTVLTPGTYTGANVVDHHYTNCPVQSGTFTLLVESCGEDGQRKQTYSTCSKYKPERFSRFYYLSDGNVATWGDWLWANTDEYILYENNAGSAGTITLNASASHFKYIEIYFTDNNGNSGGYTKVYDPDGKAVHLSIAEAGASIYSRQTIYTLSGTTLTPTTNTASYFRITSAGAVTVSMATNYLKIVRVIGRA